MPRLLLYCVKSKPYLYDLRYIFGTFCGCKAKQNHFEHLLLNGKIVAECDFEVEEIKYCHIKERDEFGILHNEAWQEYRGLNITDDDCDLASKSCLTTDEIFDYLLNKNGYAIHIKNLHIFDEPRFIRDYSKNENPYNYIENPPQNMMYAYDVKSFSNFEKKVLISIQPQEMCRIANKEQTILVRKVVLKEMLKNE